MNSENKITILFAKQNTRYVASISGILESIGYSVIGGASNNSELFASLESCSPDIIIYDLYLVETGGELNKLFTVAPESKIVVTAENYPDLIEIYLNKGVHGFFDEDITDVNILEDGLARIVKGQKVILKNSISH